MKRLIFAIISISLLQISLAAWASCDYKIEILMEGDEFKSTEFTWRMRATKLEGQPTNITGRAEIKNKGNIVKKYEPWKSEQISRQKTSNEYTPNLRPGAYELRAEIDVECADINENNNIDTKEFNIEDDGGKVNGKNDEDKIKNEIKVKPSPATKSNVKTETKPEIDEEENTIQLNDKNIRRTQVAQQTTVNAVRDSRNTDIVYESSGEKVKNLILFFLLILSILLNVILIWKR